MVAESGQAGQVALADRIIELDERIFGLEREAARLRRQVAQAAAQGPAGGASTAFDVPRTKHEWKLADDATVSPEGMWLYDVRPDDSVVLEGRAGQIFLERDFRLLSDAPDWPGAVAEVNRLRPAPPAAPEISIVIPVYGQLPYTLNALHSLALHETRHEFEIIVVDDGSPDASGEVLPRLAGIRYVKQPHNGGFIASCNDGAALAAGRYVVFLNNDTRVAAGWLDELIGSFALFPAAGLVGSKLHYADGSLQEAGGILWRDGRAWNYGRNDDPNRPHYSHARQVDYVSGCSIALPAELWRALGGFDRFFSPAYCEDVDLALRVKAAGREIWYQPLSRVVHYEGKTSGVDTAAGTKAYQIINNKKIFLRWREAIAAHRAYGDAPYFERERGVQKRLLVVDTSAPATDQDAGSVQTFLAIRAAQALGYKVHFVPEDNWLFHPLYSTALQRLGVEVAYAPYELGFETYMRRYGALFDVVLVYRAGITEKCLPLIREHAAQAAVIFHVADLHYLRMERTAELENDDDKRAAAALMKARELELVAQVDCTVSHSQLEVDVLAVEAPGCPAQVWPLMFEHVSTRTTFAARRGICFLGGYRHPPNIDAVMYFVREIFPLIRAVDSSIEFHICGSFPPAEIAALAAEHPGVILRGQIPDLADIFDPMRLMVVPLRVGAGVKGKVASALAYGLPIVSTSVGVEGSGLTGEVLVADSPADFAAAVLRLYHDPELWTRLSAVGQEFLAEHMSLKMGVERLRAIIALAFAQKLGIHV